MKTSELMGAGFFYFVQSFGANKKPYSKQTKNKAATSHMKDLLLFLPSSEKSKPFDFECLLLGFVFFFLHIKQYKSYKSCSEKNKVVQLYGNVLFFLNEIVFS